MTSEANINAAILKFIRDNPYSTATLTEIVDFLTAAEAKGLAGEVDPYLTFARRGPGSPNDSALQLMRQVTLTRLKYLAKIGLLHEKSHRERAAPEEPAFVLNQNFIEVQRALALSLTEIATRTTRSMTVDPVFGRPRYVKGDVFVIMPFRTDMNEIHEVITSCCLELGLSVTRGDDIFGASHIVQDIWSSIFSAKIIVCDCSYKNPNVFYELGIAHTLGKDVILLTQNEEDVPFDLRHWRYICYRADPKLLPAALTPALKAILQQRGENTQ